MSGQLRPDLIKELENAASAEFEGLDLLVGACPHNETVEGFLKWFDTLPADELLQLLAPFVEEVPTSILEKRRIIIPLLRQWDCYYFLEEVTNGVRQLATDELKVVRLIPQYHLSPTNSSNHYKHIIVCYYACETNPGLPHEPHTALFRLLGCLADPSRLQLLRHMTLHPRTFSELVQASGLSKSTVHHHLVMLRAAGTVRVIAHGTKHVAYTLSLNAIDELSTKLQDYLKGE